MRRRAVRGAARGLLLPVVRLCCVSTELQSSSFRRRRAREHVRPGGQVRCLGELLASLIGGADPRPAIADAFRWFFAHGRPAGGGGEAGEDLDGLARRRDAELFEGKNPYAKRGEPG